MKIEIVYRSELNEKNRQMIEESHQKYKSIISDTYWLVDNVPFGGGVFDYMRKEKGVLISNSTFLFPATEEIGLTLIRKYNAVPGIRVLTQLWNHFPDEVAQAVYKELASALITHGVAPSVPFALPLPLRPFQHEGIAKMTLLGGRVLLADEMGLGKTVQSLIFAAINHGIIGRILIIAPLNVKCVWENEIEKWTPWQREDIFIISGTSDMEIPDNIKFVIINYDIVYKWQRRLIEMGFSMVIIDEAHYIKNKNTERTKAVLSVATRSPYVLALTGTPILNRVVELWNVLNLLKPEIFVKKATFLRQFTRWSEKHHEINEKEVDEKLEAMSDHEFYGVRNAELLKEFLEKNVMIRRLKKDVLTDLPPKNRIMLNFEITNDDIKKEYYATQKEFEEYLEKKVIKLGDFLKQNKIDSEGLALIEELKQMAVKGKFDQAVEWIDNFLESSENEKIVIFAHHREIVDLLVRRYEGMAVSIQGGDSAKKRKKAIDEFQNNERVRVAVVSITAGGLGITLTSANNCVILETAWSPGVVEQAEDRIHRLGQESDSVTIWHMLAKDTIDEPIYHLLQDKQKIIDKVLDTTKKDGGQSLRDVITKINTLIDPLGLEVVEKSNATFVLPAVASTQALLPHGEWYTLRQAEEYARGQKSDGIRKQHIWKAIKENKLAKNIDVVWLAQISGHSNGIWYINKESLVKWLAGRKRGRPRIKTEEEIKIERNIKDKRQEIAMRRSFINAQYKKIESARKKRPL